MDTFRPTSIASCSLSFHQLRLLGYLVELRTLDGLWDQLAHITCTIIHPSNMAMQHDKTVKDYQNADLSGLITASFPSKFFPSFCFWPQGKATWRNFQVQSSNKNGKNTPNKIQSKLIAKKNTHQNQNQEFHHHWFIHGVFVLHRLPIGWIPNKKILHRLCTLGKSFWRRRLTMEKVWRWKTFLGINFY